MLLVFPLTSLFFADSLPSKYWNDLRPSPKISPLLNIYFHSLRVLVLNTIDISKNPKCFFQPWIILQIHISNCYLISLPGCFMSASDNSILSSLSLRASLLVHPPIFLLIVDGSTSLPKLNTQELFSLSLISNPSVNLIDSTSFFF